MALYGSSFISLEAGVVERPGAASCCVYVRACVCVCVCMHGCVCVCVCVCGLEKFGSR